MTSIKPRKTPPTARTTYEDEQRYRVWARDPGFMEDEFPWKCVASFQYLLECLDYIAHLQDSGVDCVFQSPADTKPVLSGERRAVYVAPEAQVRSIYRVLDSVCH